MKKARATLREGSAVRVLRRVGTKVGRPGVFVSFVIRPSRVLVACGTGTLYPHLRCVPVVPRELAGIALGLHKPTYFYRHNGWVGDPALLTAQGTAPPYLLRALKELFAPSGVVRF